MSSSKSTTSTGPLLQWSNCRNLGGVFPAPAADAAALLPEGFKVVPANAAGDATLYILAVQCAATTGSNSSGALNLLYAELAVVPPQSAALAGISDYTVPVLFIAENGEVGNLTQRLRLGQAGQGLIDWQDTSGTGVSQQVTATLGATKVVLTGQITPVPEGTLASGQFALYGVQDRLVHSIVRAASAGGTAQTASIQLQATGIPILEHANPVARGHLVAGFQITWHDAVEVT